MTTQRFQYKEKFEVAYNGVDPEDFIGVLRANFPELDLLWGDGTDANESNRYWCDAERTVLTGADDDLDLKALPNGPGGATINFVEIRAIFLVIDDDNTTVLTVEPGAANPWTALGATLSLGLKAGTKLRLINGKDGQYPTGAADKVLRFSNAAGASAVYGILIIGTSA